MHLKNYMFTSQEYKNLTLILEWDEIIRNPDILNNNMKNNSLRDKMLKYRAMWNSIKIKLDKNIE